MFKKKYYKWFLHISLIYKLKFQNSDGDFIQNIDKAKEIIQKRLEKIKENSNLGFDTLKIRNKSSITFIRKKKTASTNQNETEKTESSSSTEQSIEKSPSLNKKYNKINDGMTTVEENDVLYRWLQSLVIN